MTERCAPTAGVQARHGRPRRLRVRPPHGDGRRAAPSPPTPEDTVRIGSPGAEAHPPLSGGRAPGTLPRRTARRKTEAEG